MDRDDDLTNLAADRAELERSRENMKLVLDSAGARLRSAMTHWTQTLIDEDDDKRLQAQQVLKELEAEIDEYATKEFAIMDRLHAVRIEELTHASLSTTRAMVTWTKVLAAATVILALATLALIWATLSA